MDIAGKNRRMQRKDFNSFFSFSWHAGLLIFQEVPDAVLVLFGLFKDFTNARRNIKKTYIYIHTNDQSRWKQMHKRKENRKQQQLQSKITNNR